MFDTRPCEEFPLSGSARASDHVVLHYLQGLFPTLLEEGLVGPNIIFSGCVSGL